MKPSVPQIKASFCHRSGWFCRSVNKWANQSIQSSLKTLASLFVCRAELHEAEGAPAEGGLWVGEQSWTVTGGSMYSSLWTLARLKCVLRGTSWPWLELPQPTEVAHSWRSCEGGLFLLLNGCFCFRGVCAGGPFPFQPRPPSASPPIAR